MKPPEVFCLHSLKGVSLDTAMHYTKKFLTVFGIVFTTLVSIAIVHSRPVYAANFDGVVSASGTKVTALTVDLVPGGIDKLYIATIANYQNKSVTTVSGMGLIWARQKAQCSARNTNGIEIWTAYGSTLLGSVTVQFSAETLSAVLTVAAYTDASLLTPIESASGQNTLGINGFCTGGTDNNLAQLTLNALSSNTILYTASSTRGKTITGADLDYTQRVQTAVGTSGS